MTTKICSKCNIEKDVCEFYVRKESPDGHRSECKKCNLKSSKEKYSENKSEKKEKSVLYYYSNKDKILKKRKKTYKKNLEKIKVYRQNNEQKIKINRKKYLKDNSEKIKEYKKLYREKNKKKIREYRNYYMTNRSKNDILFKITINIRSRIRQFLKKNNYKKNNKTFDIVGCTPKHLKEHLEQKFTENMCWEKFGKEIHIDHIIPLSSAKNEDEVMKLCHYSNLQPLWAKDNLKKGANIII